LIFFENALATCKPPHAHSHRQVLALYQVRRDMGASRVAKILTGEIEEDMGDSGKDKAGQALGKRGGVARRDKLSPERRTEIAKAAAAKRWHR
jgi:hypothetical protein